MWPISQAISKLLQALWSPVVFEIFFTPTKERMKNWSPPNFKYCIFLQLQTEGEKGRLRRYQTKQEAVLRGATAQPEAASRAQRIHRAPRRINTGSTSERNQSQS